MRHIINRKTAIEVIILLLTLICIMTIWPLRIFADTFEYTAGGNLLDESITVNYEDNAIQKFITRYERLRSVDVYVSEMTEGRYISVGVRNEDHTELIRVMVDTADYQLP